jgi:hypothetical protein
MLLTRWEKAAGLTRVPEGIGDTSTTFAGVEVETSTEEST